MSKLAINMYGEGGSHIHTPEQTAAELEQHVPAFVRKNRAAAKKTLRAVPSVHEDVRREKPIPKRFRDSDPNEPNKTPAIERRIGRSTSQRMKQDGSQMFG